ncbi:phosphate butyryltransferase [Clostridium sp.]|uniref:phosphate butyryltransferase n=1 Tax=Clostridium sp. TaxID=1506 RepID=UPI001A437090|nr:phosphate butyryltransferase [Clostridium sp.]MBK5240027.1 phosphate butyryltransferase [Clostridium sp.]
MIRTFKELIEKVKAGEPQKISVAVAQDKDVLSAVNYAYKMGIANAILVGDKEKIKEIAAEIDMELSNFEIIDIVDKTEACKYAVKLVRDGYAALPMKGFVDTSYILKAVLNKEIGLKTGNLISHVGVLEVAGFDRLFIVSDSAMTIAPTLENKVDIINSSVRIAHALGNTEPKVAVICAVEKVNSKMIATLDAAELTKMNEEGIIKGCLVKGPLAIDNAVSVEAAKHKGINHPVAGNADILIAPDIEAGNILNKSMEYFARAEKAGVIMGAKTPIILTSRASSDISKLNSIALGVLVAQEFGKE